MIGLTPQGFGWSPDGGTSYKWTHTGKYTGGECNGGGSSPTPGTGTPGSPTPTPDAGTGNGDGGSNTAPPTKTPAGTAPKPPPAPVTPNTDGSCPAGSSMKNGACIKDSAPPDQDGKCPPEAIKVGGVCVYSVPAPPGSGTTGGSSSGGTSSGTGTGEGSGFAGNCGAGFACQGGDAIQCAIAKEQYIRNCKLFDDKTETHAALYYAQDGKEGNQTGDLPGNETKNIGQGSFDTTDALGGSAAGMTDLSITVMGTSVSLPFSKVNPYLAMLGNVLLSVAFLLSARIVARG